MKTQVILLDRIEEAIHFLKNGTPIAFPTETVYGLGAQIVNVEAIDKIFSIKGRPSDNPLIVHVANMDQALQLCHNLPPLFFSLVEKFWPGPLTLVVEKNDSVSSRVAGGLSSIAIRMPAGAIARTLIEAVGPLAAPSANLSGKPSPTTALDVLEDLNGKIPFIIDGGDCCFGIESTVLSLLEETPMLLRPGSITKEELEVFLGQKIAEPNRSTQVLSPGMKYRHYAPRAKIRLALTQEELDGYVILPNEKTLYAEFRKADRIGISEIVLDCTKSLSKALMNRIEKAAAL
ncbi:MAG TPA: L-threonylcarbamoyladenylate synthase [Chlamydiales bacterium]|nr:L-threonylcarbamoyladenylate synthase [Chlamydiales bacterium]